VQRERPPLARSYWYVAAGLVLAAGVLVAVLLPHHCVQLTSTCAGPPFCGTYCSGMRLWPRVGIAVVALAVALLLLFLARLARRQGQMPP
jgi:hypothetical protein